MIKKINFLIGAALCLAITTATAQVVVDASIKGTPYLNESYEEGLVHLESRKFKVPARYNAYKDLMEYQQNGRTMVLDPSPSIKRVQLQNSTYVVEQYVLNGKPKTGFLMLLDSGKVMLYSRKGVNYVAPRKGGNLDGSDQIAEFKKMPDLFYVKIGTNKVEELKNIKSLIASFPDKQDELTRFAKKEKISPRNEEEVIKLVRYYNTMQ